MKLFVTAAAAFAISTIGYGAAYDQVRTKLERVTAENPDLVSRIVIGMNDQGVEIEGIRIGAHSYVRNDAVHHLVVGAHHGNEQKSVDVALAFIDEIITAKRVGAGLDRKLDAAVFHVIPVLNIGGYNANRRQEIARSGRSYDPNRDYPDPCGNASTFNLASTDALAKYTIAEDITGAVTIHGYIGTFTYPWGTYTNQTSTPDNSVFDAVTSEAARINSYRAGTHADVIYPTAGAYEDWAYHSLGVWVALLEIKNNPNVVKDAQAMVAYFARLPEERSQFHEHLGNCRKAIGPVLARP